jgi:predicted nucleotidyltransferase
VSEEVVIKPIDRLVVVQILQRFLPSEAQVWVFGSRARGTKKRAADLDLAIDAGRPLTFSEQCQLEYAFEMSELPYRVDIVDMQVAHGVFRENVLRDRIPFLWNEAPHA